MSAVDLIQYLTQALYLVVFVLSLWTAIRHPRTVNIEIACLFGATAVSVAAGLLLKVYQAPWITVISTLAALAIPYLLLHLVNEFAGVPAIALRVAELGLAASIAAHFLGGTPPPTWATLLEVAYFALVTLYAGGIFARESGRSISANAKRMASVAVGCGMLGIAVLFAGFGALLPELRLPFSTLSGPIGLASGLAFYIGFTTPRWLLQSWRAPQLMTFIELGGRWVEQTDRLAMLREMQAAVSEALGLRGAFVGLWNPVDEVLEYAASQAAAEGVAADPRIRFEDGFLRTPRDVLVGGLCFTQQQPVYSESVSELDPEHLAMYRALGVRAVIAAPITIGGERFGVLGVYTPRPRLFGEDSLERVHLLAHHAAIMLRSRSLMEHASLVKAEHEVARMKEEFLSAATHDLKTPLTAIKGFAQWAQRRANSGKAVAAHALEEDLVRIQEASDRMGTLIDEMLDISRLQMARPLELSRSDVDLGALATKVAARHQQMTSLHNIRVDASSVKGSWDGHRLERVLDNLVSNAVKFSPKGGDVAISVTTQRCDQDPWAVMTVRDEGIGLADGDADHIFERFERGANAKGRGIAGTGIGLAYVREVIHAHGGQVSVDSQQDAGSTFTVKLPLGPVNISPPPEPDTPAAMRS